ncbi:MAG TPA: SpoIIIAH-like family protein [Verrucomicrobiae bacterium]|nr:SpoIIIAH-like family protein [Verrucomicrobiae bacterium]
MTQRFKTIGIVLMFIAGLMCLYIGFNGTKKNGQESEKPQNNVLQVSGQDTVNSPFFVNYRQNRENDRQKQIDLLNELINNTSVAQETRKAAQQQLLELSQLIALEGDIENLVLAKGFKDVAVKIGKGNLTMMVYGDKLGQTDITRLQDIAVRTSGVRLENIVIMPRL